MTAKADIPFGVPLDEDLVTTHVCPGCPCCKPLTGELRCAGKVCCDVEKNEHCHRCCDLGQPF